ncbi:C13 family peptidase [Aeoliella sp. ICT_H6.2]|uniref:C13 family peptidase n=1 Tax=Aeoliella straminimaris TaxID=2954799 RepID=A0A9X2JJ21_9BACT|nr:C13 family peptidase [Aeoliella straminimaris]MCO6047396.1 C13 family peptidase [Aeoliella straminimaris]
MSRRRLYLATLLWTGLMAPPYACAADYFLTIGGGYDPQGNQVSLERNVEFFRTLLSEQRTDKPSHDIYFADGEDQHRDLQFRDPQFSCSPARHIAMELFADIDDIDISYRNHTLGGVRDATSPRLIRNRLRELGRKMTADDRLLIYATAHGGSGEDKTPFDTSLYTWNHRSFRASEFADWLDSLPQSTPVVMVMVQCYAGGFSHTIFNDADTSKGLARQLRAGFFAQVHNKPAAGCTPDVNEESYQEYSSFFWAAIAGHDRSGAPIEKVDYNGDGKTSFDEAHAYAVCESETVDVPVRTSDAFLGYYSTDGTSSESPYQRERDASEPRRLPATDLTRLEGTIAGLVRLADGVDGTIIQQLCSKLQLNVNGDVSQVDKALNRARQLVQRTRRDASRAASAYRRARDRVRSEVQREWPELDSDLSPTLAALMAERSTEFETKVQNMRSYKSLVELREDSIRKQDISLDARKDEALVFRLEHALKRVVLAANLPRVASPQVLDRYEQLLSLESGGLHDKWGDATVQKVSQHTSQPFSK